MSTFSPPPGTSDIFPKEAPRWSYIKNIADKIHSLYGYGEITTPIFEYSEVFKKSIGSETEIVKKEMYSFNDHGGRELTLRPEGTAGVMRALMKTDAINGVETRVCYSGPMFRGERPAAGRKRQFHQIGVENVGKTGPEYDAECIIMLMQFFDELKITGPKLLLNTRGTIEDRGPAEEQLKKYFEPHLQEMCDDCKNRFTTNIWRILDCKAEKCQHLIKNSPPVSTFFSEASKNYFESVTKILKDINIPFEIEPRLVRGIDYYEHTVFEVQCNIGGQNSAVAGGGRYRISLPGSNKSIIGVGYAAGVERLIMAQDACNASLSIKQSNPIFLVSLGSKAKTENLRLAYEFRKNNIFTMMDLEDKSMKAQMRSADKYGASKVIIRGDNEIANNTAIVKDMLTGSQAEIPINNIFKE